MKSRLYHFFGFVVLVGAVGLAWHTRSTFRASRETLESLTEANRDLTGQLRRTHEQLSKARARLSALRAQQAASAASAVTKPHKPVPNLIERLRNNPELQVLQLRADRALIDLSFGPFFRSAALSPQEIEKFSDHFSAREERRMDAFAALVAQRQSGDAATYRKVMDPITSDYEAAQRQLLGEVRYGELQKFEATAMQREVVAGFADSAALAGEPIDGTQAEQLVAVLAHSTLPPRGVIDWATVVTESRAFLSPRQVVFLETTESSGPRGMGVRFLQQLHAVVDQAAANEAGTSAGP